MPEINMIFQCFREIFALSISKKSDCLVSIAVAIYLSSTRYVSKLSHEIRELCAKHAMRVVTQNTCVVPHTLCVTPHAGYVATSISIAQSISYSQHRSSEIALRANYSPPAGFDS